MPIYEYKCEHCGERFEVLQKFSDEPLTECILCSEGPVKKLISSSSFILKGAGFYVNDYGKKPTTTTDKKSSSASTSENASKPSSDSTKSTSTTDAATSA